MVWIRNNKFVVSSREANSFHEALRTSGVTRIRGRRSAVVSWSLEIPGCDRDTRKAQLFHEAMRSIEISSETRDRGAR